MIEGREDILKIVSTFIYKSVGHQSKSLITDLLERLLNGYLGMKASKIEDDKRYIVELETRNLVLQQRVDYLDKEMLTYRARIDQLYVEKEMSTCSLAKEAGKQPPTGTH